jgi:predicted Rossmann-fold nucleotide-binding protein
VVAVRDLAAELTRVDCIIVTGGGPGIMRVIREHHAAWTLAQGMRAGKG